MPKVEVKAEIELQQGTLLKVTYPGITRQGRGQWADLGNVKWSGSHLTLPSHQFTYGTKVKDVVRARWNGGVPLWERAGASRHPQPREGAIVIVLESPHEDEYDYRHGHFRPIEPLMDSGSQKRLKCHSVRLVLAAAAAQRVTLEPDVDVVLVNPIQFQASLHRLIRTMGGSKGALRQSIRNATWRGLWNHLEGGKYPFQEDFKIRLGIQAKSSD